jgi:hypothetical protein
VCESSVERIDDEEGVYFFSAIVDVSVFAVVDKVGIALLDGAVILPDEETGIGIVVLRGTGKLLEAPFDDFVAFPCGTDAGADMVTPLCSKATIRAPQFGQKCAADVANGISQSLQFIGCTHLCIYLYRLNGISQFIRGFYGLGSSLGRIVAEAYALL